VGAESGKAVVEKQILICGGEENLLWDAWDAGAYKIEPSKDFSEKKSAREFANF
jgi:hypothetical protein